MMIDKTGFINLCKYEVKEEHIHRWMKQSCGRVEEVKQCVKQIMKQGEGIVYMKL
jgi:Fe2+ or Zn2+ uptake regulation protein